ncbi:hypothetical protein [Immundisolibacter sp.]|uniref:hypothetical protein n=1 Tax=Immundisolibacter sp. TaxID=1934948 RepID=UPI003F87EB8A
MSEHTDRLRGFYLMPMLDGGWKLLRSQGEGGLQEVGTYFRADPVSDPTGELAYENALAAGEEWRSQAPPPDRRTDHAMRCAITRLRLIEMRELTSAIDGVVDLLRAATEVKA